MIICDFSTPTMILPIFLQTPIRLFLILFLKSHSLMYSSIHLFIPQLFDRYLVGPWGQTQNFKGKRVGTGEKRALDLDLEDQSSQRSRYQVTWPSSHHSVDHPGMHNKNKYTFITSGYLTM